MIIYKLPEMTPVPVLPEGCALALGNFDGVHRGHQRLFSCAREQKCPGGAAAWSFTALAKPDIPVPYITDTAAKLELFAAYGLDYAVLEDFAAVRDMSARDFAGKYLAEGLRAGCVVCGFNFRFGKGGAGDAALLSSILTEKNVRVCVTPPVTYKNHIVSSSLIRETVLDGDMETAAALLGHPFSICFPVVYGNQLGRTIGIPTINQDFPSGHIIPKRGIYACVCRVGSKSFNGVANVGVRPTVSGEGRINCETHIIDYSGILYGRSIRVDFYCRLRDEIKFAGVNELKAQIEKDVTATRNYFAGASAQSAYKERK